MRPETRDLLAYLDRVEPVLGKLSHFELLDVEPGATGEEIQRAYHVIAARMHPDRHKAFVTAEQYERLNVVYGRITEAYRVLRSDAERDDYTRALTRRARGKPETLGASPESAVRLLGPKAQRFYRRAMAALRTNDRASALLNLKMALRENPQSAFLRAALTELEHE
jgi:curved DNA-binding protein CbpA